MTKRIKTDILVVGGGLSGCMAAINALDHGAKVAIVEKSHTERSGAAGTGNDHFWRARWIQIPHDLRPLLVAVQRRSEET